MINENKTHGVLTDREIMDAMLYGQTDARVLQNGRAVEAAVLAKAAQQSPVAPADERDVTRIMLKVVPDMDGMGQEVYAKSVEQVVDVLTQQSERIDELENENGNLRRCLADAPTVSATLTQLRDAAAPLGFALVPLIPTSAMNDVFATEDWRWSDLLAEAEAIDEAQQAFVDENENAAPTPPTSAADAVDAARYRYWRAAFYEQDHERMERIVNRLYELGATDETPPTVEQVDQAFDEAIAASKKESGDE